MRMPSNAALHDVFGSSGAKNVSRERPHERILISANRVRAAKFRRNFEWEGPEAGRRQPSPPKREAAMLAAGLIICARNC